MSNKIRTWNNKTEDSGAVHAVGNGKIVAYGQGPNLINFFGPPYSSPNILTIETLCDEEITDEIKREPGTAIWNHSVCGDEGEILNFSEFIDSKTPTYFRCFNVARTSPSAIYHAKPGILRSRAVDSNKNRGLDLKCAGAEIPCNGGTLSSASFIITPHPGSSFIEVSRFDPNRVVKQNPLGVQAVYLLITHAGGDIFHYPTTLMAFHWIIPSGNCEITKDKDGNLIFKCLPGKSSLAIVGDNCFATGLPIAEKVAAENIRTVGTPSLQFLNQTRKYWNSFTEKREKLTDSFGKLSDKDKNIIDGVATLIKAQQSDDGGAMAGHYYPLAYVRDQYGVAKGMLALGMVEEAKQALQFRIDKFNTFGNLHNAESMGTDCVRHVHENDDVEQTGYIILQARDYFNKTGDSEFIETLLPMLEWCWNAQLKHLAGGSLPFNGDETYVAGGFFPRSGLLHGSADSTLVFIEGGKWFADWSLENSLWEKDYADEQLKIIDETRRSWRQLFFDKNKIYANAPEREKYITPQRFRHGICENQCPWFGWTQRTENGRYQCPLCFGKISLPPESPGKLEVNSVSLLPPFIESDILSKEELTEVVNHVLEQAYPNGHIPTIPGGKGCVGYDPGFLLYALSEINHPAAEKTKQRMIEMLDDVGAWTEYYDENDKFKKANCRCRPWESAINAAAIIKNGMMD